MLSKNQKQNRNSVAARMMERFIENGSYPHLKQSEGKLKILSASMKQRLESSELKRHEFQKYGLVGRFSAKKIYETDTISLNEYLYDLGLLLHVVEIDNKKIQQNELYFDMIQDFKLEPTFYMKPNFNKAGKLLSQVPSTFDITDQWGLQDIARTTAILKPQVKRLNREYDKLKSKMLRLTEIEDLMKCPKEQRAPIKHKYGSLSLLENQARYDIASIYNYFGEWLLIEYGLPNGQLLENYILNGTITKRELESFKTMKDIRLDFSIMTLEDEQLILNLLDEKQKITAANRMGA